MVKTSTVSFKLRTDSQLDSSLPSMVADTSCQQSAIPKLMLEQALSADQSATPGPLTSSDGTYFWYVFIFQENLFYEIKSPSNSLQGDRYISEDLKNHRGEIELQKF